MASMRYPGVPDPVEAAEELIEAGVTPPAELVEAADRYRVVESFRTQSKSTADLLAIPVADLEARVREAALQEAA